MADPNTLDPAEGSGLAGLLRAITAAETCDFADARPLAAQAYHSEALLRWEIEHLFRKEWIRAGRGDDVPSPADFLTTEVAGTPILSRNHAQRFGYYQATVLGIRCPAPGSVPVPGLDQRDQGVQITVLSVFLVELVHFLY